jgi:hypothetical protein
VRCQAIPRKKPKEKKLIHGPRRDPITRFFTTRERRLRPSATYNLDCAVDRGNVAQLDVFLAVYVGMRDDLHGQCSVGQYHVPRADSGSRAMCAISMPF